jgi:hypothetical protein
VEELESARLIIELLRQASATNITSNQDDASRNNVSHVSTNQVRNAEWVEVNSKRCGATNKDKDKLLKRAPTRANAPITVLNRYSILEEDNTDEGCVSHFVADSNVVKNKPYNNPNDQLEAQCIQELSPVSQDIDGKRHFKIPTLINGSIIMDKGDTFQQSHGRKNSASTERTKVTSIEQHKVLILGDSHLRGSVVKLRNELSPHFKVCGVIRPGAGAEKIVNSFAEDLQNLHSHDDVLNAGANDVYKDNKGVALTQITKFIQRHYVPIL